LVLFKISRAGKDREDENGNRVFRAPNLWRKKNKFEDIAGFDRGQRKISEEYTRRCGSFGKVAEAN
jgi:hypothetical protein